MKSGILSFVFLLVLSTNSLFSQKDARLQRLDKVFEQALKDWEVPGMAIAITSKDDILFSKGYGVKEVNKTDKVDANTLFAVASNSKSFTAAAIGILVDQGKLKWDDKVVEHLPWFKLYDPYVTANMTIRDLLSHRSGLVTFSGDIVWHGTHYTTEEVVRRARFLKPAYGFRTTFGYSNIMYLAAGLIVEKVSGQTWDEFTKENFLTPLGMNTTLTSITQFTPQTNLAMPHATDNDKTVKINYLNWDNMAAAGGLISSANEMSKWLQLQLKGGKWNDMQIISEKSLNEMWYPQIMNPVSKTSMEIWPQIHFKGYGLGWSIMDYYGKKVISHSGGYDGIISYTAFVPEANIGFVILTNKLSSLYLPMIYTILDAYLAPENTNTKDWSTFFLDREKKYKESEANARKEKENLRATNTKPSAELSKYVGTYKSELYGEATIGLREGKLYLQFVPTPLYHGWLNHWQYDTFTVKFPDDPTLPEGTVNFVFNANGDVKEMRIDIPNPDFDFTELDFRK